MINDAVIYLKGDFKDTSVTGYLPSIYFQGDNLSGDKLDKSCYFHMDVELINFKFAKSPSYEDYPFVWVSISSPWSNFNLKEVLSNVEVKVTYSFTTMSWIIYGGRLLWFKIKEIVK